MDTVAEVEFCQDAAEVGLDGRFSHEEAVGDLAVGQPPGDQVRGSAAELVAAVGGEPVDAVVSVLPWTVMPQDRRGPILDAVTEVLAPGGRFTTFAYLHAAWTPPARHFAAELARRFDRLERSKTVWTNLPPAFVHRAVRKP